MVDDMEVLRLMIENEVNRANDRQFEKMKSFFVSANECASNREKVYKREMKQEESKIMKYGKPTAKYSGIVLAVTSLVALFFEIKSKMGW